MPVSATGDRYATAVVQGYVAAVDSEGRATAQGAAGVRQTGRASRAPPSTATLTFDARAFARWDADGAEWVIDPGDYDLVIAASAADERARVRVTVR